MHDSNVKLTSSEIACIWTSYMNNSMSVCILSHMKKHIEDSEIKAVIDLALTISIKQVDHLATIFKKDTYEKPYGFSKNDVNLEAPALFTDTFCLFYINHMAKAGLLAFSGLLSMSVREDIVEIFTNGLADTSKLFRKSTSLLISKGLIVRSPYILVPKTKDYVDSNSYLSGFHFFHKKRPLNSIEISHLFMNTQTNNVGSKISLAFAQTSANKDVQQFMMQGKEIAQKHIKIFMNTLLEENLQSPMSADIGITNSTIPTFSDKLIMFHMSLLSAAGIGNYSAAAGASQRSDLAINYERLSFEIAQYAKGGADLMIKNSWLEQPPGILDRTTLVKNKKSEFH
ncbi:DUF3231 family protein [Niallia nealsonii]|uniref:DUF3231 family protein n=1 Tax=Niallia nealsonii TaxID=115979 RepID=A0A2N0YYH4_9BACI|nr:DUF3231 family protein [Niallia nealsonii]PKG22295.1 hypothetical protein CWS01_17845 [Niallia nealsonii]